MFGRPPPAISETFDVVLDQVFQHVRHALRLEIWEKHLTAFSQVLRERSCPEGHCFGFVDGTMFTICRPTVGQEAMYNGWKRHHKVKYQCVVLPNFMIGDWFGSAPGRAHDSQVSAHSVAPERPPPFPVAQSVGGGGVDVRSRSFVRSLSSPR